MIKNSCILLVLGFLIFNISIQAQYRFLQGIGAFIGETSSRDKYINSNPTDLKSDPNFLHAHPPSHNSTERESWSAGVYVEMLRSADWRWVSEIDFCNKGAKEGDELLNPITNQTTSATNKYGNIQWNNHLKRWIDIGLRFKTYAMVGARIEYTLIKSTPAYSYVAGNAAKITVSPDAAVGAEFHLRGPWNLFAEEHYNPDILKLYNKNHVWLRNRTWETRVGIIYRFKSGIGAVDLDCNAPRYHGR
ncbi:MAG TPA: hypothetical protein VF411_03610 [Bacteroidia bacterium]